jgi:hypothetical protein
MTDTTTLLGEQPAGVTSLRNVKSLRDAFLSVPDGREILRLAEHLGLITDTGTIEAKKFPVSFSNMTDTELSNNILHTTARSAAFTELLGVTTALKVGLKARVKSVRSSARLRIQREHLEAAKDLEKKPPALKVADVTALVDEDSGVMDVERHVMLIDTFEAMMRAAQDSHIMMRDTLSREISFRSSRNNRF